MEQWEHMSLHATFRANSQQLVARSAEGTLRKVGDDASPTGVIRELNRLGLEGWHLVTTDRLDSSGLTTTTYWLRRRLS